jgi:PqqD family protein of HPr-rel-A system
VSSSPKPRPRSSGPRLRSDLTIVELDGEAVIYDDRTGHLHHLNPTATTILSLLGHGMTLKSISAEVAATYQVDVTDVEPQVKRLVRVFRRSGLLESKAAASDG